MSSAMAADRADQMVTWEEDCGCPGDCGTEMRIFGGEKNSSEVKLKRLGLGFEKTHTFFVG